MGDVVVTSKQSWFGTGIRGEVARITPLGVTLATDLTAQDLVTVRSYHVLVVERRTGFATWFRKLKRR